MLKADGSMLAKIRYSRSPSLGELPNEVHLQLDVDSYVTMREFFQSTNLSSKAKEMKRKLKKNGKSRDLGLSSD